MIRIPALIWILLMLTGMACNRKSGSASADEKGMPLPPALPRFAKSLAASDTLAANTDTLLYYQRSACFGFCPTFSYTVYQNGMIKYDGIQHVEWIGTRYGLVTEDWWKLVQDEINKARFFELQSVYPVEKELYIPDLPNTIVIVKEYGMRKQVTDNHHAPKELKDFEIFLEAHFQKVTFNTSW
ncbi:MAG TPA: DUF6438 domain-containing protein [Saprospiraceae bacterium]|nr:DUF6438 domain-containing protein [Saprospiraceae bacterium]